MKHDKSVVVRVRLPSAWVRELDEMVAKREVDSRSGAIRVAIRHMLMKSRELA